MNTALDTVAKIDAIAALLEELRESLSTDAVAGSPAKKAAPAKVAPAKTTPAKRTVAKPAAKAAPEPEEVDEDEDEDEEEDEEEEDEESEEDMEEWTGSGFDEAGIRAFAKRQTVAELRRLLVEEHGYEDDEVAALTGKAAVSAAWIEAVLAANEELEDTDEEEEEDEDDVEDDDAEDADDTEDEDEEEDEEEDDEDEVDYESMSLRELRAAAKAAGYPADRTKGADKDALIALLRDELEDDDEDTEEDEDADEDGDEDEYDPETMSDDELRALAKENGIRIKRGASRADMIAAMFE